MVFASTAALPLAFLAVQAAASRTFSDQGEGQLPVYLIVARHGVSCANIIEQWSGSLDFMRGRMPDPMLGGVGKAAAKTAGEHVKEWLDDRGLKVDAVMSSVLMRAMETALLMMPDTLNLEIVPYIREHAMGKSNSPLDGNDQDVAVKNVVGPSYNIDRKWVKKFGREKGSWQDFTGFLQDEYLPELLRTRKYSDTEEPGPIVLVVATHSKFLQKHAPQFSAKCKHHWEAQGWEKPVNNQVFALQYTYTFDRDAVPRYLLKETDDKCEEVFEGTSTKDARGKSKPLCMADIGKECFGPVRAFSFQKLKGSSLLESTVEAQLWRARRSVETSGNKVQRLQEKLGCERYEEPQRCADRMMAEKPELSVQYLLANKAHDDTLKAWSELSTTPCMSGEDVDVQSYLEHTGQ